MNKWRTPPLASNKGAHERCRDRKQRESLLKKEIKSRGRGGEGRQRLDRRLELQLALRKLEAVSKEQWTEHGAVRTRREEKCKIC